MEIHMNNKFTRTAAALTLLFSLAVSACAQPPAPVPVGHTMPDGTIYAGISPDTNKPMYTTPANLEGIYSWYGGKTYCETLETLSHRDDWRVPTRAELNVLYNNRAAIGGFNTSDWEQAGWYWSSTDDSSNAWGQRFSTGYGDAGYVKGVASSVRCIR